MKLLKRFLVLVICLAFVGCVQNIPSENDGSVPDGNHDGGVDTDTGGDLDDVTFTLWQGAEATIPDGLGVHAFTNFAHKPQFVVDANGLVYLFYGGQCDYGKGITNDCLLYNVLLAEGWSENRQPPLVTASDYSGGVAPFTAVATPDGLVHLLYAKVIGGTDRQPIKGFFKSTFKDGDLLEISEDIGIESIDELSAVSDNDGAIHVALNRDRELLYLRIKNDSAIEPIAISTMIPSRPEISIAGGDVIVVSYRWNFENGSFSDRGVYMSRYRGGSWEMDELVVSSGDVNAFISMACESDGTLWMAFTEDIGYGLQVLSYRDGAWSEPERPRPGSGQVGRVEAISFDAEDQPIVLFHMMGEATPEEPMATLQLEAMTRSEGVWTASQTAEALRTNSYHASSLADLVLVPGTGKGLLAWIDPNDTFMSGGGPQPPESEMWVLSVRTYP